MKAQPEYYQPAENIYLRIVQIGDRIVKTRIVLTDHEITVQTLLNWAHGGAIAKVRQLKQVKPTVFFTMIADALLKAGLVAREQEKPEIVLEVKTLFDEA